MNLVLSHLLLTGAQFSRDSAELVRAMVKSAEQAAGAPFCLMLID